MKNLSRTSTVIALSAVCWMAAAAHAEQVDVASQVKKIRGVGAKASGHAGAIAAAKVLSKADADQLPMILAGMDGTSELAMNWLRVVAETVAQRGTQADQKLPVKALEEFLADTKHAPRARRLAYELILHVDKSAKERLIPGLINDPSLELRRDAVAMRTEKADSQIGKNKMAAARIYREALTAARDLDQVNGVAKKLRDLGEKVDLSRHFGFVMNWKLAGPFDNADKKGFEVAYPPETAVDLGAKYTGKDDQVVEWKDAATTDEFGVVDLNEILGKHKGAITYAYAEFTAGRRQPIDLRLGCINANKIWLNGELLTANEVYHANTSVDQYTGSGELKKGKNKILVKICQNEQTESWAQRWQFQLRVCDQYGTAVLSVDRPTASTASLPTTKR